MALTRERKEIGPVAATVQTDRFYAPEELAGRVVNFEKTEVGSLRSCVGPVEYHPARWHGVGIVNTDYNIPAGLFHAKVGHRDILLAHFYNGTMHAIWEHGGWSQLWFQLIGPTAGVPLLTAPLPEADARPAFPTQFCATPTGIVIVPQGGRAYFYDGEVVAPLGFAEVPGPPSSRGPRDSSDYNGVLARYVTLDANDVAYSFSGRNLHGEMGTCRLGTVNNEAVYAFDAGAGNSSNELGAVLEDGEWRAAVQFVDYWGNLSAVSPASSPVAVSKVDNLTETRDYATGPDSIKREKVQVLWTNIDPGPPHTIARNLYRTRDQRHTSMPGMFWVPPNAAASPLTFATLHDNTSQLFPDNTPDAWLLDEALDLVPVPVFKLCALAFGRLWVANFQTDPGAVRCSEPNLYGTFQRQYLWRPDPGGNEITGLAGMSSGLLVFTRTSVSVVVELDTEGSRYGVRSLSSTIGCEAPDSIQVLLDGSVVWFGRGGFYRLVPGQGISRISQTIEERHIRRVNWVRAKGAVSLTVPKTGVYRCWIPVDGGSTNNQGLEYDGEGWRELDYIKTAYAACVTRDHRALPLVLGGVMLDADPVNPTNSVWVLDHDGDGGANNYDVSTRDVIYETGWLRNPRAGHKASPMRVNLWLRETSNLSLLEVSVMRDWRRHPSSSDLGPLPPLTPDDDNAAQFWDTATFDATYVNALMGTTAIPTHYVRRRPFVAKVDVFVPSCEVFRLRLRHRGDLELLGLTYEEVSRDGGGTKRIRGQ